MLTEAQVAEIESGAAGLRATQVTGKGDGPKTLKLIMDGAANALDRLIVSHRELLADRDELVRRLAKVEADSARLDWLGAQEGVNLVSDDAGMWAVSGNGSQPVPPFEGAVDIVTQVESSEWKPTIREAIDVWRAAPIEDARP